MHINYTHRPSDYTQDVFVNGLWVASAKNNHAADLLAQEFGGAEPEDNDPPEEGPCDDINIPCPDNRQPLLQPV